MNPYEMGRVSAFLERYRRIEEKSQRRQISREEKDLALLLREASEEVLAFLHEMLRGRGFWLVTLNSFEIRGIPEGCRVHLLVRRGGMQPLLLDTEAITRVMDAGGKVAAARIWFTQIWLTQLDLLYTQRQRAPTERNRWLDVTFTRNELTQAVRAHINDYVRRINPSELKASEVYEVLCSEKGAQVENFVRRFLALMVDGYMLEEVGKDVYRQTMLAAVEMKENYDSVLAPLMLEISHDDSRPLAQLGEPLLTRGDSSASQGQEAA